MIWACKMKNLKHELRKERIALQAIWGVIDFTPRLDVLTKIEGRVSWLVHSGFMVPVLNSIKELQND